MNAINKPNEVSMFKVGDKVVFGSGLNAGLFTIKSKPKKNNGVLLLPVILPNGSWFDLIEQFVRHATPEEIAVGHRIESSNDQAISDCSLSNLCQNDTQNSLSIKQENQDMGDDSHIENHVSPNCKVGVK